ncbi:sigma-54-dependent Fis family transcriptional regulator [Marinococcus luteus]|uniref:sigma-54-dependent Fis family transcriptional regulator n=1 Tax=Marinococcus luteus TaxID=1122204 RepID=UPI002ACC4AED|nr:sigma-54-dependent Fis family transcriptional regulator [Marinococcus luteus]MDZ5782802.1 sigma-54-dependent Fis family transcriptional regulator [Marinococcus luteus]
MNKAEWNRWSETGMLDRTRMEKRIAESWHTCAREGVDPAGGIGQLPERKEWMAYKKEREMYLEAADPMLRQLQGFCEDMKLLLLLTDEQGKVLYINGHRDALAHASSIHFGEGVTWTDRAVGTNAIGTSLSTGEPIVVVKEEHYAKASKSWECAAVPVYDGKGGILGVLDMSSPFGFTHKEQIMGTVVSAAFAIERSWQEKLRQQEIELLQYALAGDHTFTPYLLTNAYGTEVYRHPEWKENELGNDPAISRLAVPIYSAATRRLLGYRYQPVHTEVEKKKVPPARPFFRGEAVGVSPAFEQTIAEVKKAAKQSVSVHLFGETGTGKEVMARLLHNNSEYRNGPFIAVNCGAIPENLLESELFGYEGGAFTGAKRGGAEGKIREAKNGTLFLDEISEISSAAQVAFLRVLQEKRVTPVGSRDSIPVNFRLITASNKNITELVQEGSFRQDLYYRIYVYPLTLPPLRQRMEDLPELIRYISEKQGWSTNWPKQLLAQMAGYDWPGNIRELFNVLERMYTYYEGSVPMDVLLEPFLSAPEARKLTASRFTYREQMECDRIERALEACSGRVAASAKQLGMARSTLYRKLKKYGLE